MELCEASLNEAYLPATNQRKYRESMPPDGEALYQMAKGLQYLDLPGSYKNDIWAMGRVFFYLIRRRDHPFGNMSSIQHNVIKGKPVQLNG